MSPNLVYEEKKSFVEIPHSMFHTADIEQCTEIKQILLICTLSVCDVVLCACVCVSKCTNLSAVHVCVSVQKSLLRFYKSTPQQFRVFFGSNAFTTLYHRTKLKAVSR